MVHMREATPATALLFAASWCALLIAVAGCAQDEPAAGAGTTGPVAQPRAGVSGAVGGVAGGPASTGGVAESAGTTGSAGEPSSGDPSMNAGTDPSSGPVEAPGEDPNGQTGSMGSLACVTDQDCADQAESGLAPLRVPSPAPVALTPGLCAPVTIITDRASFSGNACECTVDGSDGNLLVGPDGAGCFAVGRAYSCLWDDSEWDGCDPSNPIACVAVCADLEARRAADAARSVDATLLAAECGTACRAAVEIDGRCFAAPDWSRTYDCALGGEAILAQAKVEPAKPTTVVIPAAIIPYVAGSDGFVQLTVKQSFEDGQAIHAPYFAASAQLYAPIARDSAMRGEVIEPLDGTDDCGVFRQVSVGTHSALDWRRAGSVTVRDGSASIALPQFVSGELVSYGGPIGRAPRHGARYGIRIEGGQFGAAFDSDALALPLALSIPALEQTARIPREALALSWTGSGDAPLRIRIFVQPDPNNTLGDVEIICLLTDDGEFTIPTEVLQAAPAGTARALITRSIRMQQQSAGHDLLIDSQIETTSTFTLADP